MRRELTLHPGARCAAVSRIEVAAARPRPGRLTLRYAVAGRIGALRLPPWGAAERAEGLWRHTCFEAFVRAVAGSRYYEFHVAPSTQWAAYGFDDYRNGMSALHEMRAPRIEVWSDGVSYTLDAVWDLGRIPGLPGDEPWRIGLSAVIEEAAGNLSYWALAHPRGRPDFHHSDCFAAELAPAWRP